MQTFDVKRMLSDYRLPNQKQVQKKWIQNFRLIWSTTFSAVTTLKQV